MRLLDVIRRVGKPDLAPGAWVEITVGAEENGSSCCGEVVRVGRGCVTVAVAEPEEALLSLTKGEPVLLSLTTEDGVTLMSAEVERVRRRPRLLLQLRCAAGDTVKQQRREYFRVRQTVNLRVSLGSRVAAGRFIAAEAKDISGGGILIELPGQEVSAGEQVELKVFLPGENSPIEMPGRVKRVTEVEGEDGARCEVGIEFTSIDEESREAIIRYLFRAERNRLEQRKRKRSTRR